MGSRIEQWLILTGTIEKLISTYDFRNSEDLSLWRNGGYTAFGVSRYTGGRNNRCNKFPWAKLVHGPSWKPKWEIFFSLMVGFILEVQLIQISTFGEVKQEGEK